MSMTPSVYIKGKNRYKTCFGIFMTLTVFLIVATLSAFLINSFFNKREINVVYFRDTKDIQKEITIPYLIFKFADVSRIPVDPRVSDIVSTLWIYNNSNSPNVTTLSFEKCSIENHFNISYDYQKMFDLNVSDYDCINMPELTLKNHDFSYNNTYFNIYVQNVQILRKIKIIVILKKQFESQSEL